AMEPPQQRFPASHQPPRSTARGGPRLRTLPARHGGIRMAAQPRTAMAPVPGPRPQPDQPKATGHLGLVPIHVKPAGPGEQITKQSMQQAAAVNSAFPGLPTRSDTTINDGTGQVAPEPVVLGRLDHDEPAINPKRVIGIRCLLE